MKPKVHPDTEERLALLSAATMLDGARDPLFDDLTALAAEICVAPVALVSLLEEDRQIFKSAVGTDLPGSPMVDSICGHAIFEEEILVIEDTAADVRTADNGFCVGPAGFRFYAGAVVRAESGVPLGSLCVLDREPRGLTDLQRRTLLTLARQASRLIELRRAMEAERTLAREIDHRTKNSLQLVASFLRMQRRRARGNAELAGALAAAEQRVAAIGALHEELYQTGTSHRIDAASLLRRIVKALEANLPAGIELGVDLAPLRIESHRAAALGLIVNEFATNAMKHAFPGGSGRIAVTGRRDGTEYHVTLTDDGVGLPDGGGRGEGLGLEIIEAASLQLGAEAGFAEPPRGTRLEISIPLGDAHAGHAVAAR